MKNRPWRVANIAVIALAFSVALGSTWYRTRYGDNPLVANGGLIGLTLVLLFQTFYDSQVEIAVAALHARIDLQADRIRALESAVARADARPAPGGPRP